MTTSRSDVARIALIGVLLVAVVYLAVWRPRANQVAALEQEHTELSQDLEALAQTDTSAAPATDGGSEALVVAVPPTDDLANLLRQFQSIAADTGVEQRNVTTAHPVAVTGVAGSSIPVTITIAGPRPAALEYVRRLGVLPRLFVVDSVNLDPAGAAGEPTDDPSGVASGTDADRVQLDIAGRVFTTATAPTEATDG
jgi:Tfp pilus assembly protein PilO